MCYHSEIKQSYFVIHTFSDKETPLLLAHILLRTPFVVNLDLKRGSYGIFDTIKFKIIYLFYLHNFLLLNYLKWHFNYIVRIKFSSEYISFTINCNPFLFKIKLFLLFLQKCKVYLQEIEVDTKKACFAWYKFPAPQDIFYFGRRLF